MIVDRTNTIIKENKIHAKKMFGQNFLKDKNVLLDIIKASNLSKDDCVIEIGPGLGALTELLCQNSGKVLCYEIDDNLAKELPNRLKKYDNYVICNQDFLKCDIKKDIESYFGYDKKIKVVANIPYNITTPIIFKLLEINNITHMTLMVQKELAYRFSSDEGNKEYGSITAYLKYLGMTNIYRIVDRSCFEPVPNVDSAVFTFERNDKNINNDFLDFLRIVFAQKRKNLFNNLKGIYGLEKDVILNILSKKEIEPSVRAEQLNSDELYDLFFSIKALTPMKLKAYAKVNLILNVLGKFDNGYHNLEMLNKKIDLYDEIEIKVYDIDRVEMDKDICEEKDNLVFKAIKMLKEHYDVKNNYLVKIKKNIPNGAGLAGGSSDAATVIKAILKNENIKYDINELYELTKVLGADIPFCLQDRKCIVRGIGEKIIPIKNDKEYQMILAFAPLSFETKRIFAEFDKIDSKRNNKPKINEFEDVIKNYEMFNNDLEKVCIKLHPEYKLNEIKMISMSYGAKVSQMTGSGSSCYALFELQDENIEKCLTELKSKISGYSFSTYKTISY
jgi:16S rRNA (adenine1518-N6/adenine1519-N6)-dimethyltransferase